MGRKSDIGVLHKFNYPPYAVRNVNRTDLVVCGGGGASKTGVPNQLDVLRLRRDRGRSEPVVEVLSSVETDLNAVMNLDVLSFDRAFHVFTGQADHCLEYVGHIASIVKEKEEKKEDEDVRKRNANKGKIKEDQFTASVEECRLEAFRRVRTDPSCQNVVRVASSGKFMVTGGSDGTVRIFTVAELRLVREIKAHEGEIADLDISGSGSRICTVSNSTKEKYAILWREQDGTKVVELALPLPPGPVAYRFKHCRFGRLAATMRSGPEAEGSNLALYTTHIPVNRGGPRVKAAPCYVTAWDCVKYRPRKVAPVGPDIVCSIAVSDEGRYVGLGTIEGSVSILTAFNLLSIYKLPAAHSIFVTAIDFVPAVAADKYGNDCELISISADNRMRWHKVPRREQYSILWPVLGAVVVIYILCYTMAQLGL